MITIIQDDSLIPFADLEKDDVWILSRTTSAEIDSRIHDEEEITQSLLPDVNKFPLLFSAICESITSDGILPADFDYRLICHDREKFKISFYVCDEDKIEVAEE